MKRSANEIAEKISQIDDPTVYFRNYNETTLSVYHGSLNCGWTNPGRVTAVPLGEAEAYGLRPCISCGYLAQRSGDAATAA
jgi:hypothetical protein